MGPPPRPFDKAAAEVPQEEGLPKQHTPTTAAQSTPGVGHPWYSAAAMGKLKVTIIAARGVPSAGYFMGPPNAYAFASVGITKFRTPSKTGCNPTWSATESTFEFEVHVEDVGLIVTIWREGWGYSLLGDDFMGRVEIPFLDLEDWSGCVIGRVLEAADPEAAECLEVDLKASIEWY